MYKVLNTKTTQYFENNSRAMYSATQGRREDINIGGRGGCRQVLTNFS